MGFGFLVKQSKGSTRILVDKPIWRHTLICFHNDERGTAILLGRLHYRADRLSELGISAETPAIDCGANDAAIALEMWHRFGANGLARLEGNFSLVLVDKPTRKLIGMRDPLGAYPLFWSERLGQITISSDLTAVVAEENRGSLDFAYVGGFLIHPHSSQEMPGERTIYKGIQRVAPGGMVTAAAGEPVKHHIYWDWLTKVDDHKGKDAQVLGREFETLLNAAVRERTRGRFAENPSGGTDATSVAVVSSQHSNESIQAISLVDQQAGSCGETKLIDAVLNRRPDLSPHNVLPDQDLDFDAFMNPPAHDEPYSGLWRMSRGKVTIAAARCLGARTLLTGLGADEAQTPGPSGKSDQSWKSNIWDAIQNPRSWQFWKHGLSAARPVCIAGTLAYLCNRHASWSRQNQSTIAPWITKPFSQRHGLRDQANEMAARMFPRCRPMELNVALNSLAARCGDVESWTFAAPHHLTIAHPFLDPRVLRFGLGLTLLKPDQSKQSHGLTKAMHGMFPAEICDRRVTENFSGSYHRGLSRHLPHLQRLIDESPLVDAGVIDPLVLGDDLRRVANGTAAGNHFPHRLNQTLCFLRWHRTWEESRRHSHNLVPISFPASSTAKN